MSEWLDYLTSSQGMPLVNGIACVIFAASLSAAIITRRINIGSAIPRIEKAENPRAYWALLALLALIAGWTGLTAVSALLSL